MIQPIQTTSELGRSIASLRYHKDILINTMPEIIPQFTNKLQLESMDFLIKIILIYINLKKKHFSRKSLK